MLEWLKIGVISLGGVIVLWVIWEMIQFYRCSTVKAIERVAGDCVRRGIGEFYLSRLFGINQLKVVINPSAQPVKSTAVKAMAEPPSPARETHAERVSRLLRERRVIVVPSYPESEFGMPKYIDLTFLGKREICELVPVTAPASGRWFFAYEEELPNEAGKKKSAKIPLGFLSYIVPNQVIGTVVSKTSLLGKGKKHLHSTVSGQLIAMQVQNGDKILKGAVVCFLACPTDLAAPLEEEK